MSLTESDKLNTIDMVVDEGKVVYLIIMEGMPWSEIKNAEKALLTKIENYRKYMADPEFLKKCVKKTIFGKKTIKIRLAARFDPPSKIKDILKREKIELQMTS